MQDEVQPEYRPHMTDPEALYGDEPAPVLIGDDLGSLVEMAAEALENDEKRPDPDQ